MITDNLAQTRQHGVLPRRQAMIRTASRAKQNRELIMSGQVSKSILNSYELESFRVKPC